jgi:hypothetical protein
MTYQASVFFAKMFDVTSFNINVTATAVTEIPNEIAPMLPFVITYCTIADKWEPPTSTSLGGPKSLANFAFGAANGAPTFDTPPPPYQYKCVANNIVGKISSGSNVLTVTDGDFKRLTVGTDLKDALGNLKSNTKITGVGTVGGAGILTNCTTATPCTYYLSSTAQNNIDPAVATDLITSDSGPLGSSTPLVYSANGSYGANVMSSYIPSATSITGPLVSIGEEILVEPGVKQTLYQQVEDCRLSGRCAKVTIPVVNGLPCLNDGGVNHECPATSASDPNFPLTGVPLAPLGIPVKNNFPVIGFACVKINCADAPGSACFGSKSIYATLDTGCKVSGKGGGNIYYGVLLPPKLAY